MSRWCCPACRGEIAMRGTTFVCDGCGQEYVGTVEGLTPVTVDPGVRQPGIGRRSSARRSAFETGPVRGRSSSVPGACRKSGAEEDVRKVSTADPSARAIVRSKTS